MRWTIKRVVPEHREYDGFLVEHQEAESEIPFNHGDIVYYVHRKKWWKRRSPYVITKCNVTGVWATNIVGVILDNNNHVSEDSFSNLFTDKTDAIEFCLKKNTHRKVKIYGE